MLRRSRLLRALVATGLIGAGVAVGSGGVVLSATAAASPTWPTYHGNAARTGVDPNDSFNPATPAWTTTLGDAVYGQPVIADGRVFAATEGDRVVAINPRTGAVLWSKSLGTPLTNVDSVAGCGDIDPLGITSTPVVDTANHTVYVVGEVATGPSTVHHQLEGFNTFTGALQVSDNVDPTLPAGENRINLLNRASLALGHGRVYVGYGGNAGDCGNYHGWLVSVKETGAPSKAQFEVAPNGEGGAIWEPGGPSIDNSGNVYASTGNSVNPFPSSGDPGKNAESVVKLSPTLAVEGSFKDTAASADADLSTDPPTLIPGGEVFSIGKTDIGYVLRQSNLSEIAAIPNLCGGANPDGGNAYDAATHTIFIPCRGKGIQEVNLANNTAGPMLTAANSAPILTGADIWASSYPNSSTLTEFDASSGAVLQTVSTPSVVPTFASPSAALGLLMIGTTTGVTAWRGPAGLPPNPPAEPKPAPAPAPQKPGAPAPSACAPGPPSPASGTPSLASGAPPAGSYLLTASDGGVFTFGGAQFHGSTACEPLVAPVVGGAADRATGGYWEVASDGGVFSFDAPFEGSAGGLRLQAPVVGIAVAPGDRGYWLVASDGGVFNYGSAKFFGSMGGTHLNAPIVGIASTPDGKGYWLVASDGGVFAFGDAKFFGSMGGAHLNKPIVGMTAAPGGYRLVASDGGIFDFGQAHFAGSLGNIALNAAIVGMAPTPNGRGYWLVASDGGVFALGDAHFAGSMGGIPLVKPVVGIMAG